MNNIKYARINAGFSQKQVSTTLKVSAATVSQWESGLRTPTADKLKKLSELFGVTTDFLLGGIKKEPIPKKDELNPKAQVIIEQIQSMSPEQLATLEKLLDLVSGLKEK